MAMDKPELIDYKKSMEAQLRHDELALQRLKLLVTNQRDYIKLLNEQIESFESVEEKQPAM